MNITRAPRVREEDALREDVLAGEDHDDNSSSNASTVLKGLKTFHCLTLDFKLVDNYSTL